MPSIQATAITAGTVTAAVPIVGAWLWIEAHFIPRAEADKLHAALGAQIQEIYIDSKIDAANTEMDFIEQGGVDLEERRKYDLLKFSVERLTGQLLELRE